MKLQYHKSCVLEEEDGFSNDSAITHHSPSAPLSGNGNGFVYKAKSNHLAEEPVINFKANNGGYNTTVMINNNGGDESVLSFQQKDQYFLWNQNSPSRLIQDFNSIQSASCSYGSGSSKEASSSNKRLSMGDQSIQASKKQCITAASKTPKATKSSSQSKDPQSIAAKNRRERISERLKILQELVPNGSKVDLVTMLEKAISYVKFLQLQVKVLATDEFWPVQGGKAPDITQVKEAIDAILSSQRERGTQAHHQINKNDH